MSTETPTTPPTAPTAGQQTFSPPARWDDIPFIEPMQLAQLVTAWTDNVNAWTQQAIVGNPWNVVNASNQDFYFNPLEPPASTGPSSTGRVTWSPLPHRIEFYYPQLSPDQTYEMVDTGVVQGVTLPEIPTSAAVCTGQSTPTIPYGPYGPRGWQDEYCEWAVTRDQNNNIVRVDFTCENPEYWHTLWSVSPERVAQLYQQTLGKPQIQLSDLYLYDVAGHPVIDPSTGRPAYNPLNRWNSGTVSTPTAGGAMHLTSTPNNLGAEIALAGAATVQRSRPDCNSSAQALLCCGGPYGQPQRNSDPTIGQEVNGEVQKGNRVTLADPVGLYIQTPTWIAFQLPDDPHLPPDAQPSECWQVVRGYETLDGFSASDNFILHAVFQIPQRWKDAGVTATVSDMSINLEPIRWGAQIANQFTMGLFPLLLPAGETPPRVDRVSNLKPALAQPLQLSYQAVFNAYYAIKEPNPRLAISLASNTVLTPPRIAAGTTAQMVLICDTVDVTHGLPTVEFLPFGGAAPDPAITATVTGTQPVAYAIPGNSYPGTYTSVQLTVQVTPGAAPGLRDVRVTNAGQEPASAAPGFLVVTP